MLADSPETERRKKRKSYPEIILSYSKKIQIVNETTESSSKVWILVSTDYEPREDIMEKKILEKKWPEKCVKCQKTVRGLKQMKHDVIWITFSLIDISKIRCCYITSCIWQSFIAHSREKSPCGHLTLSHVSHSLKYGTLQKYCSIL